MFSAADLIDVVAGRVRLRRRLRTGVDTPPGEFPPAWTAWFAKAGERPGKVTGATAGAIVAVLAARELAAPPRRTVELNRWQAFATLWRQQWTPPEREDRRVRWLAAALTTFVHLVLLVMLFWLASVRFLVTSQPQGEEIVQVEYIGTGTPVEQGGGAPAGRVEAPVAAAAPVAESKPQPPSKPAPPTPAVAENAPSSAQPSAPAEPAKPAPVQAQPLQVTEVPVPTQSFVLPPPAPRAVEIPQATLAQPALKEPVRDIELAKAPADIAPTPPRPTPVTVPTPVVSKPAPAVVEATPAVPRQAPTPAPPSPRPVVAAPPSVAATTPTVTRAPPLPAPIVAPAAPSTHVGTAPTVAQQPAGQPAVSAGTAAARPATGGGATASPKPGAQPTPWRGDEWGVSTRNRPGGNTGTQPGLFNADGSPRLSAGTAEPGGGFPPGSDHWTREQFDRAGTWLKRPPNDYTPTRFDKVWVPNETLLEEWVRRNVRTVSIPIPGTSKKIECKVSLLQLGGGCTISDPNMNDQEAEARPPPDIPFKPELQEDQQSLRKSGGP